MKTYHLSRTVIESRFWKRVDKAGPDECWPWTAARMPKGYGCMGVGKGVMEYAHRLAFWLVHGEIPDGKFILHHCDNPPCVNPAHLYAGTHQDNMNDMKSRGRQGRTIVHGESHSPLFRSWNSHARAGRLVREWRNFKAMLSFFGDSSRPVYRVDHARKLGPNNWSYESSAGVWIDDQKKTLEQWGALLGVSKQRAHQLHRAGRLEERVRRVNG